LICYIWLKIVSDPFSFLFLTFQFCLMFLFVSCSIYRYVNFKHLCVYISLSIVIWKTSFSILGLALIAFSYCDVEMIDSHVIDSTCDDV